MRKRLTAILLVCALLLAAMPVSALAKGKRMEDGVPVWSEKTVKEYVLDYLVGEDMERLWGYYDLQVRRYMPMTTYRGFLSELAWKTGDFEGFGAYESYDDTALAPDGAPQKVHVLHLCMEKQDLDLYFMHKNAEDDWEVMAVEFVFADKQEIQPGNTYAECMAQMEQERQQAVAVAKGTYMESSVLLSDDADALPGTLFLPDIATEDAPVPAVLLVHDDGPYDRDETRGETQLFADIGKAFAEQGIAVLCYDKRSYAYPSETGAESVKEDVMEDAIAACKYLRTVKRVDKDRIYLVGHGLGAMLAPRIVANYTKGFAGMVLINGSPKSLLDLYLSREKAAIAALPEDEQAAAEEKLAPLIETCGELAEGEPKAARALELFGRNGYYYYEMDQEKNYPISFISRRGIPTLIISGGADWEVSVEDGYYAYENELLSEVFVSFRLYKGLNHLLMTYTGDEADRGTEREYDTPAHLDEQAAQSMIDFILK